MSMPKAPDFNIKNLPMAPDFNIKNLTEDPSILPRTILGMREDPSKPLYHIHFLFLFKG